MTTSDLQAIQLCGRAVYTVQFACNSVVTASPQWSSLQPALHHCSLLTPAQIHPFSIKDQQTEIYQGSGFLGFRSELQFVQLGLALACTVCR